MTTNWQAHHDPENEEWLILEMTRNYPNDERRIIARLKDRGPETERAAYKMAAAEEMLALLQAVGDVVSDTITLTIGVSDVGGWNESEPAAERVREYRKRVEAAILVATPLNDPEEKS